MGTLANSDDPDEMPHHAAFRQGLHCLLFSLFEQTNVKKVLYDLHSAF